MIEHHLAHTRSAVRNIGHAHTRAQRRMGDRMVTWWACSEAAGGPCALEEPPPPAVPPCRNGHPGIHRYIGSQGWSTCSECHREKVRRQAATRKAAIVGAVA